ncbi:MAG: hypothetical protein KGL95_10740 [Patescibacteria group bacterium]|nr:hypothetical protein [Patescibacteria group bacterium]
MKNLLLIGFLLVILFTIPITLYLVSNQTNNRGNASAATQMNFIPSTKTVNVGDSFTLDINLNPGQGTQSNNVAFVDLVITIPNNLTFNKTSDNNNTGIKLGTVNGASIIALTDPKITCATQTCIMKMSLGMPPNNTVKVAQPIATLYLSAASATDPNSQGAEVSFTGSQALSIANGDKPRDNILAQAQSAFITVNGAGTPTPTDSGGGGGGTPTDTPTPTTSGGGGGGGGGGSNAPVCSSLTADNTSATSAPATITYTAAGNSANSTIAKVSFNFGDGNVQDVTTGGGIGTNAVSVQLAHLYATTGTFTASATLTDGSGATSTSSCSQTVTIGGQSGGSTPGVTTTPVPTSTGSIPSTGPGETIMAVGLAGAAVMLVGGLFLFGL